MNILFNKKGFPLMAESKAIFAESTGRSENAMRKKRDAILPYDYNRMKYLIVDGKQVMVWGKNNSFPQNAEKEIVGTSVLNTGLKFLRTVTLGQGLFACKVSGFDARGNEIMEPLNNPEVDALLNGRMVRRYLEKVSRDYFKFGCGFAELIPDAANKKIVGINPLNARYCRITVPDLYGKSEVGVSGYWPKTPTGEMKDNTRWLPVLKDFDPEFEMSEAKTLGKLKNTCFKVTDSWSNDDYYGEPIWLSAYILGWVEISHLVPQFLKSAYRNQVTWKWHVQIPYSFWERKFPEEEYEPEERKRAIQEYMDAVERNLCGPENAEKPLISNYAVNEMNGKIEEEWKITALDNKYKGGENLVTSAAANSEILFSLMVNPTVLGATPSGNYTTNAGGSNIREAFLVNIANAWVDRQNLLDPIRILVKSMFNIDVDIRFRNTILTTLDSGSGTSHTLS